MLRQKKISRFDPDIHERIEQLPELHLAGLVRRVSPANSQEMPVLWRELESLRGFPGELDSNTYLVILGIDPRDGAVEMMPSLRVRADAAPPRQLRRQRLAGGPCTVFRHVVRKGDVYPQLIAAREALFALHLPHRSQVQSRFPYLEVYPQGLSVTAGSWIDHYFPLQESPQ